MTDYLERVETGTVDALLEQTRRLEQALSGLGARGEADVENRPVTAFSTENERTPHEFSTFHERNVEKKADDQRKFREDAPSYEEEQEKSPPQDLPLMEELTRLNEAVEASGGSLGAGTGTFAALRAGERGWGRPGVPGVGSGFTGGRFSALPEPGESARSFAAGLGGVQPGGEFRLAEQADRVFRRDSRRYDGGFYLY